MFEKLYEIQGLNLTVVRDTKAYNYKYATLDQVWGVLQPELQKRNLVVYHAIRNKEVATFVISKDGGEIEGSFFPLSEINDPQKLGSAITYGKRYNLVALFNIMTDDDDDGYSASQSAQKKQYPKAQSPVNNNDLPF